MRFITFIFILLNFNFLIAQVSLKDSCVSLGTIQVAYQGYMTGGDYAKRFGFSSVLSGELGFKNKSNWMFTISGGWLFGAKVKDFGALDPVLTSDGFAIDSLGELAPIKMEQRGWNTQIRVAKIFSKPHFKGQNPNSGFYVEAGLQLMSNKIFYDISETIPYLNKNYLRGYDRKHLGIGLVESVGYRFFSSRRIINFFIAVDFSQNFSQNVRKYSYDLQQEDKSIKNDFFYGFRVGWALPLYKRAPEVYYYN